VKTTLSKLIRRLLPFGGHFSLAAMRDTCFWYWRNQEKLISEETAVGKQTNYLDVQFVKVKQNLSAGALTIVAMRCNIFMHFWWNNYIQLVSSVEVIIGNFPPKVGKIFPEVENWKQYFINWGKKFNNDRWRQLLFVLLDIKAKCGILRCFQIK